MKATIQHFASKLSIYRSNICKFLVKLTIHLHPSLHLCPPVSINFCQFVLCLSTIICLCLLWCTIHYLLIIVTPCLCVRLWLRMINISHLSKCVKAWTFAVHCPLYTLPPCLICQTVSCGLLASRGFIITHIKDQYSQLVSQTALNGWKPSGGWVAPLIKGYSPIKTPSKKL